MKKLFNKFKKSPKWFRISIYTIVILSITVHLFIPPVLKYYLNKELNNIEGHYGYIEDVDVSLIRGAYRIEGLHLYSDELGKKYPLAVIEDIDISIQWKALFKGSLVAEIEFLNPEVNFVITSSNTEVSKKITKTDLSDSASDKLEGVENENKRQRILKRKEKKLERKQNASAINKIPEIKSSVNNFDKIQLTVFRDFLLDKIPLNVNHVAIKNGKIHYIDKSSKPDVDIQTTEINFKLNNLTNSNALSETLIADFKGTAIMMGSGKIELAGTLDPYDEDVSVDLDFKMNGFQLKELNPMFMAYASFDVDKGSMSIYSEISTLKGELNGYIKPFVEGLSILDREDDGDETTLNYIWQSLLGGSSRLTRNFIYNELATKIPLKGNVSEPGFKVLNTIGNLFLHAIFHSIKPTIDEKFKLK